MAGLYHSNIYLGHIPDPKEPILGNLFIPSEANNVDCQQSRISCDPTGHVKGLSGCSQCRSFVSRCEDFGGQLDPQTGDIFPDHTGFCVPADTLEDMDKKINTYLNRYKDTTHIIPGFILSEKQDKEYLTRRTQCVNVEVVGKDPKLFSLDPVHVDIQPCTEIKACHRGKLINPKTGSIVEDAVDIDFDISLNAELSCACEMGYSEFRDNPDDVPHCRPMSMIPGFIRSIDDDEVQHQFCPVTYTTEDGFSHCVCNPATQVNLTEILASADANGLTGDYDKDAIGAARQFAKEITKGRDACLPKMGVADSVAMYGYSAFSHLFFDKSNGPKLSRLEHNMGGHLMTGSVLRRSGVDTLGQWHSPISRRESRNEFAKKATPAVGGVVNFVGTGSVLVHDVHGDRVNNAHGLDVGAPLKLSASHVESPNATHKAVAPSSTMIPGVGRGLEHATGMVVSMGRVYPGGVFSKTGDFVTDLAVSEHLNEEKTMVKEILNPSTDNPLIKRWNTNDPGACVGAFVVPFAHDKCRNRYGTRPDDAVMPQPFNFEKPNGPLVSDGFESVVGEGFPILSALSHTPYEKLFRLSLQNKDKPATPWFPAKLRETFPDLMPWMSYSNISITHDQIIELWNGLSDYILHKSVNVELLDSLGGIFVQPTTAPGVMSTTHSRWYEEVITTNTTRKINHYQVDDYRAYRDKQAPDRYNHTRYPTGTNVVGNHTGFYSGRSLGNLFDQASAVSRGEIVERVNFTDTQVLGLDNVLWRNFSTITLPPNIPSVLPETMRFTARNASNLPSKDILKEFRNVNAIFWGSGGSYSDVARMQPPRIDKNLAAIHLTKKFFANECRTFGDKTKIQEKPSSVMAEAYFQSKPLASWFFIKWIPSMILAKWGTSQHTAGNFMEAGARFSPPMYKFILNADGLGAGAMNQFSTMMVPKNTKDAFSVVNHIERDFEAKHLGDHVMQYLNTTPYNSRKLVDFIRKKVIFTSTCNDTIDLFCDEVNEAKDYHKKPSALLSRGNKYEPYIFQATRPIHNLKLFYTLSHIFTNKSIANHPELGLVREINSYLAYDNPVASTAHRFQSTKSNLYPTYLSHTQHVTPQFPIDPTNPDQQGSQFPPGNKNLDIPSLEDRNRRDKRNTYILQRPFIFHPEEQETSDQRFLLDVLESSTGVAPNTVSTNTFTPWHEGPGDVVAMYGTPAFINVFGDLLSSNEIKTTQVVESPIRMIHSYRLPLPSVSGFESGPTASEGALSRGAELWFHPFVKPSNNQDQFNNSLMEGISHRAGEPFDHLAIHDWNDDRHNWSEKVKVTCLHHFGLNPFLTTNLTQEFNQRLNSSNFPFSCPSNRYPFPLNRQMCEQIQSAFYLGITPTQVGPMYEENQFL